MRTFKQAVCQQVVSELPSEQSDHSEHHGTPSSARRFSISSVRSWIKSPERGFSRFLIRVKSPETVDEPLRTYELQPMLARSRGRKTHHRHTGSRHSPLSHMADVTLLIGEKMKHDEISI